MFLDYILKYHFQDCLDILSENDNLGYYSMKIDFMKLFEIYPDIGDNILCNPVNTLRQCDEDIIKAQQNILESDEYKSQVVTVMSSTLKRNVHARFFGLPVCPELHRSIFPKNVDMGCFLKVTGTVVRVTQAKMLEYHRKHVCMKCKHENYVKADFEQRYVLKAPTKCGNDVNKCKSSTFTQVNLVSREHCKDYQEIKIQEQVNKLSIGTIPGSMWVVLEDDLVDGCKPGDDVHVCGTVRRRWRPTGYNKKCEVELVLHANYLEVCNAQRSQVVSNAPDVKCCFDDFWEKYDSCPLKGRDQILSAVSPQVYGLHLVKLALLLTVITGSDHVLESSGKTIEEDKHTTRVRGQCHLLLVGDPGTGKSQLLRTGAELTSRSVFTSGGGTTRAGLTCAALREDGEWQLEAGALVLSDGGICCIDEIGQLREHDRASIHEAMEQQTISIAKAGIVCKLNTRCAVVAACNPKGHYDTEQPLSVNVSLGTPLLSRFDLIFILLDTKNKAWDKLVSSYILFGDSNASSAKKQWSLEKLQTYIALVGPRQTKMTKSANVILQTYYMAQRKTENRDPCRTTVRMLDSLVRLSQAHCRLMYRTTILPTDAIVAVTLVDLSMQDCTLNDTVDALHSTFPKYPDFSYLCTARKLLTRLNLYQIWQEELLYYAKILGVDHHTLQSEIEHENCQIFTRYDDITDDNIPLSASLVTSSYFDKNKCKKKTDDVLELDQGKEDANVNLNPKLVATLKKHATINKEEKKPPIVKKGAKRKRTVVTVETSILETKTKKVKTKGIKKNKENVDSDIENGDFDQCNNFGDMLKAVPSVNDVFSDLGVDFKFDDYQTDSDKDKVVEKHPDSKLIEVKIENVSISEESHILNEKNNEVVKNEHGFSKKESTKEELNTTHSKLQRFMFTEKRNLDKFYDVKDSIKSGDSKLKEITNEHSASKSKEIIEEDDTIKKPTAQNSQLSIFETSDYDINLDESGLNEKTEECVAKLKKKQNSETNTKSVSNSQISIFETSDCDIDLDI